MYYPHKKSFKLSLLAACMVIFLASFLKPVVGEEAGLRCAGEKTKIVWDTAAEKDGYKEVRDVAIGYFEFWKTNNQH